MSDAPRKSNGQINPRFKKLINEELGNLTRKIKVADKEYKKIAALTAKATTASQKEGADKEKIKKQLKTEIDRRKKARDKANRDEDLYKDALAKRLAKQNIGIPVSIERMWFNVTYTDNNQHWLHTDSCESNIKSIVLFLTPVWVPEWQGSFHVDGEEFKFKPGNAIIFDSKEYHTGKTPVEKTNGWSRLTCNILVK